jgi:aminopeptidase YwaD
MKYILGFLLLASQNIVAQNASKEEAATITNLKTEIYYLADDKLEGRRTGTAGEKLAYEYLETEFKNAGFDTFLPGKNYIQPFDVNDGKSLDSSSFLTLGNTKFILYEDFVPLAFSAGGTFKSKPDGSSRIWVTDLTDTIADNKNNPHFDLQSVLVEDAKMAADSGASVLFFIDNTAKNDNLSFNPKDKNPVTKIPVIFFTKSGSEKFKRRESLNFSANIIITEKHRTGHNVVGYINNHAANTIIIGAHYDHLGYGEDHNSLYTGNPPMIHNGADDNASGTAALLELGKWLKKSDYKKYNYLLISFSGEELGLFGSKYFSDHPGLDLKTVDYSVNKILSLK